MTGLPTRNQITLEMNVLVELKQDQGTEKLTEGIVSSILTPGNSHPYGIMVELSDGKRGRVKQILGDMSNEHKQDFDELEYQKYLEEISEYRRHTTPQYEIKLEQLSSKIFPKLDIPKNEDPYNEFKKTFKFDSKEKEFRQKGLIEAANGRKKEFKKIEHDIKKEISIAVAAFGNTMGGKLFIGVDDDGTVVGLDDDMESFKNFDAFLRAVQDSVVTFTQNRVFVSEIIISIGTDEQFLVLEVKPFRHTPIFIKENLEEEFYIRGFGKSDKMPTSDAVSYIQRNFNQ